MATCPRGGEWSGCTVKPYGPLALDPAATILNYGQGVFEGMKAFRTTKGRIVLFRPEMNAERMASGAERFLMPPVPTSLFLDTVAATVRANADWVPPVGEGELYLRPLLFGSGGTLGVGPSPQFTFLIYGAPVGKYFKGQGARLLVEEQHQRAAPRGSGDVKCMGNYAPCFKAQAEARGEGYSDILYLDVSGVHIEEAAASNFFIVDAEGVLRTPKLQGTILPGVTRDSVLQLAELLVQRGETELTGVEVGDVSVEQVFNAREAFVTGTGAGVTPVAHVARSSGTAVDFATPGPATSKLQEAIQDVKFESVEDELGWLWDPFVGA